MRSNLIATESNTYRQAAMADVVAGIHFKYNQIWSPSALSWVVMGQFNKDGLWCAYEYADDECLKSPVESAELYEGIDNALVDRMFRLKRIERKLAGVI